LPAFLSHGAIVPPVCMEPVPESEVLIVGSD
jgi:hypothetical protein